MKEKKRSITDYINQQNDDIRTIPDFYDNLYPTPDPTAENSVIDIYKKRKIKKKQTK